MDNPFYAFVDLVELDAQLDQLSNQREKLTAAIEKRAQQFAQEQQKLDLERNKLHDIRKQIAQHELEDKTLRSREQNVRKKLEQSGSAKEYSALEQELGHIAQDREKQEAAIFELWQKLAEQELQLAKLETGWQDLQNAYQEQQLRSTQEQEVLHQEYEQLTMTRSQLAKHAPQEFVSKYETMRKSVRNPVVPVINNQCSACLFELTPADFVQVRRHVLLPCKSCYRLLYYK